MKVLPYLILTACAITASGLNSNPPKYNFTAIPKVKNDIVIAYGLNNKGQLVGTWNPKGPTNGFLYFNGTTNNIPNPPNENGCDAFGINDAGQIVGNCIDSSASGKNEINSHAVIFYISPAGYLNLGGTGDASATEINNKGQIVGYSDFNSKTHAAIFLNNGTVIDLGTLQGSTGISKAIDINDQYGSDGLGQIVGWSSSTQVDESTLQGQVFLYEDGLMTNIGQIICPNQYSLPTAINNAGQVVGYCVPSQTDQYYTSFVYDSKTNQVTSPSSIDQAFGINDSGWIVGYGEGPILLINGQSYQLMDLIANPLPHGISLDPISINNQNQIGVNTNQGCGFLDPI